MGPLTGIRIVEITGGGPGPFAAMMLSDMGADVIRIDRKGGRAVDMPEITTRGRPAVAFDLKVPAAIEAVLKLVEKADALIEGFRPGVMERLGLGPDDCSARNPKLIYGRMTGWGQTGPLAMTAGHDIDYIALSGALHAIGTNDKPLPPLNLIGDYGGGGLYLAFGIVCGILESRQSGRGQIVDAAMVDGAASLMTIFFGMKAAGAWLDQRGANLLDGGAHFYNTYETKDGQWIALGAIEPQFYRAMLEKTGATDAGFKAQMDRDAWPALKQKLAALILTKTRDEWDAVMRDSDACYAPVLSLAQALVHPHNVARETFVEIDGIVQPAPAPRFSRTNPVVRKSIPGNEAALGPWGFARHEIEALQNVGAIG